MRKAPDNETNPLLSEHMIGRRRFVAYSGVATASIALFGLSGCGASTQDAAKQSYTAGTYTGTASGKKGPIEVETVFSDSSIDSVKVVSSYETLRIAKTPFERIPQEIVDTQSLDIDVVSGASLCSAGLLNAVADCVTQAGGNVHDLKSVPGPKKSTAEEEIDADSIVIGAGAAGLGAAIEASLRGADVVVFEKCANFGGNMLVSGGVLGYINAPDDLRQDMTDGLRAYFSQTLERARAIGVPEEYIDLVQKQYDDYYAVGNTKVFDSPEWQAIYSICGTGTETYEDGMYESYLDFCQRSVSLMDWLDQFNVGYKKLIGVAGYPWPGNVSPSTGECGEGYCAAFERAVEDQHLPIDFLFSTPASELITDESGKVTGAKGTCENGTVYTAKARKGVIIATGGFAGSTDLLLEHDDEWGFSAMGLSELPTTNAYGHTGDGLSMAMTVGATFTSAQPNYMLLPFANAVDQAVESIVGDSGNSLLVNKEGKRFVDETLSRNEISKAQMKQTDQFCYLISGTNNCGIVDGLNMFGTNVEQMLESKKLFKADTLDELAEIIGIDPSVLVATVDQYNGYTEAANDPDFGRTMFDEKSPILEAPYYANPCHWAVHITNCGISSNAESGEVLDASGNPIPGLYAIGEAAPTGGGIDVMSYGIALADRLTA